MKSFQLDVCQDIALGFGITEEELTVLVCGGIILNSYRKIREEIETDI